MSSLYHEETERTQGTVNNSDALISSPIANAERSKGTHTLNLEIIAPLATKPVSLNKPKIKRPCYNTYDDWFEMNGRALPPGLYYHGLGGNDSSEPIDTWICSPIYADALTCNEHGIGWGLLLRFINPDGKWLEWAMPVHLLKGYGDEMRGELLDMGVRISPDGNKLLHRWLASSNPQKRIVAATRTGWHEGKEGTAFVFPQMVLGSQDVRFQSEYAMHNDFSQKDSLENWIAEVGVPCQNNDLLLLAVSSALAGPLLKIAKFQDVGGAGIHLVGDSSRGKTTALQVAASVWGPPGFIRTWRATGNGLEAIAESRNDTFLPLDESGQADSRDIGSTIYALFNGVGKQRAKRTGGVRDSFRWRTIVLSSGECSIGTHMSESGKQSKAGQQARLLDVPATHFEHGLFQHLHGSENGRAFADRLKRATNKYYGQLGLAFVQNLLSDTQDLPALYADACTIPDFFSSDGVESRAAGTFALIGMAGELAIEYGLTGWTKGTAIQAAITAFHSWRRYRGIGVNENYQILQAVRDFIVRYSDARFSELNRPCDSVRDRAGWWIDRGEYRVYLFSSTGLKEAAQGFDIGKILDVLDHAGWIHERNSGKRSKKVKVNGLAVPFYWICQQDVE